MANSKVTISELDFDKIKANLKTYLSGQSTFADYNFEGSGLSTLLDVLAYNTHYNGVYANMLLNELFLDSAVKRSSAVSRAKEIGYIPRSPKSAVAKVRIKVITTLEDLNQTLTLPRGTLFEGNGIDGNKLSFININSYLANKTYDNTLGQYVFDFQEVSIYEGTPITNTFEYNSVNNKNAIFEILNKDIDTDTLRVVVKESVASLVETVYQNAKKTYGIDGNSNVYYVQENYAGNYELQFGDGILGKQLSSGNVIIAEYLVSSKADGNDITVFSLPAGISSYTTMTISTITGSSGGMEREDTDSIKFNAPKTWASQNRAVTVDDYKTLIYSEIPNIESAIVWGGEDNEPPEYGKVFMSVKPITGFSFTDVMKKNYIDNLIRNHNIVTIIPEFVDPNYLYVTVDCTVKYDSTKISVSEDSLRAMISSRINTYFDQDLQKFNKPFYYSKFIRMIDDIDTSILGNNTIVQVQRRFPVIENALTSIDFNMINTLVPGTLKSTIFKIQLNGVLYDVRVSDTLTNSALNTGKISLLNTTNGSVLIDNAGSINYTTGAVSINALQITDTNDANFEIRFNSQVVNNDITSKMNFIITLDDSVLNSEIGRQSGLMIKMIGV